MAIKTILITSPNGSTSTYKFARVIVRRPPNLHETMDIRTLWIFLILLFAARDFCQGKPQNMWLGSQVFLHCLTPWPWRSNTPLSVVNTTWISLYNRSKPYNRTEFCLILLLDRTTLLRIDCGAENSYDKTWQTDKNYVGTGTNMEISDSRSDLQVTQLNTLRVFKQQIKSCYTIPAPRKATYFIRAGFYYGNYDKLKDPPTFDIEFDGNKWATVETAMPPLFQYNEVVYKTQRSSISVCLSRTKEGQFPFISTLEIWPLADNMYRLMDRDVAWFKNYRYNYGLDPDTSNWILG